ncbi:hypothetical protein [Sinomonas humi]|uniref:hypothetical protein n=1 Tax=Sinomonas humi TaxID=1338436 RepID=UPI0012DFF34A|nr:hypothetical protein [Sinomonas humi]
MTSAGAGDALEGTGLEGVEFEAAGADEEGAAGADDDDPSRADGSLWARRSSG